MEDGLDFTYEDDDKNEELWKDLRRVDNKKQMPTNAFIDWEY